MDRSPTGLRLDLGRRAVGDDPAPRHQHDPVRVGVGLLEVVRREDDVLPPLATARIASQKSRRASTSSAAVGSSSTSRSGLATSARAKRTRWVWPPESFVVRWSANWSVPVVLQHLVDVEGMRVERSDHVEQLADREVLDERAGLEHPADAALGDRVGG